MRVYFLILLLISPLAYAADFGVLVDTGLSAEGKGPADAVPAFSGSVIPWFTTFVGDNADLYFSVRAAASVEHFDFVLAPEPYRIELDLRFGDRARLKAGRMYYSDPLGFIADGLFDGAQFSANIGGGRVYAGGWYTGLLYKKTANITMNSGDSGEYYADLDYKHFYDSYFASKRVMAAIGAEHLAFADLVKVKTAIIAQFDMNRLGTDRAREYDRDSRLHSQYFSGKVSVPVNTRFIADMGGVLELSERYGDSVGSTSSPTSGYNGAVALGGAAEIGLTFLVSPSLRDHLTLTGRFASGREDGGNAYDTFTPITTVSQGNILQAKLSGLSMVQAQYVAPLLPVLSMDLSAAFFFKDEKRSYSNRHFIIPDGYFLGFEQYARMIWSPASDVKFNFGGGAFVPRSASDPVWKVNMGITVGVF